MEPSKLMLAAVHAYHRSERDGFALLNESIGGRGCCKAEAWPGVSTRVRRPRHPGKLWGWAIKRWGIEAWPRLEYDIRQVAEANRRKFYVL